MLDPNTERGHKEADCAKIKSLFLTTEIKSVFSSQSTYLKFKTKRQRKEVF
jgi:hypothetical protein